MNIKSFELFGIRFNLFTATQIYSLILDSISKNIKTAILYSDFRLLKYHRDNPAKKLNNDFNYYPDSTGLYLLLKLFYKNEFNGFKKIISTDINYELLRIANQTKSSIFLLGSESNILKKFIAKARQQYPQITITGYSNGFDKLIPTVFEQINNSRPTILLIGMGVPKQELWLNENYHKLNVPLILTIGGFYEYYSGHKKRAPKFLRLLSLEWLIRLINDPTRLLKRYFIEYPLFVAMVVKEKYFK